MSSSVRLKDVCEELHEKTYNRHSNNAAFIPYSIVQEVWAGDRLERFIKAHADESILPEEIEIAQTSLLRMVSLLITIHWDGWTKFRQIFFLHPKAPTERRDNNIKTLREEDLKHDSFLDNKYFAGRFIMNKWMYIPITLDGYSSTAHDENTRLPLVRQGKWSGEGGYGIVTKELIPPNHLVLKHLSDHLGLPDQYNSSELLVARKRFPGGRHEAEITQLSVIQSSSSSHKRIVYPLAIVTVGNDLNIIMPCADMDLREFLAGRYRSMPPSKEGLLKDLLKESCELAAALEFLHQGLQAKCEWPRLQRQAVCHADFKPENILVFKWGDSSTGIWRITDFGVSRLAFRSLSKEGKSDSGMSIVGNPVSPKGGIYEAPDEVAHRRSDIWSFGCILVRIVALGLNHGIQSELHAQRASSVKWWPIAGRFYEGTPPTLNWEVKKWIDDLPSQYGDSYDVSFLAEIRNLLRWMLKIDFTLRPNAGQVHQALHALCAMQIESIPAHSSPPKVVVTNSTPPTTPSSSARTLTTPRTSDESTARTPSQSLDLINLVNNIREGSLDLVDQILQRQPDIDLEESYKGDRPLIHAIEEGSAGIIRLLWNHKPDLDVKTTSSEGEAPLHLAVSIGDVDKVKALIDILIENGDKDSLSDVPKPGGKTPLMEAAERGHVAVVSELLRRGADPRITISVGETRLNCLHYAVKNIKSKEDLIEAFKDRMVFDHTPSGLEGYETPMMLHISLGLGGYYGTPKVNTLWEKKFNVLLAGGANVNRSYPLISPLQLAKDMKNVRIVEMIVKARESLPQELPQEERGRGSEMRNKIKKWIK